LAQAAGILVPDTNGNEGGQRVFTFETTHHALWAEEVARDHGVPAEVVPAPPAARARCNLALETLPADEERMAALLDGAGVPFGRWAG
jgi:DNA-binding transcriptional MerR regulator